MGTLQAFLGMGECGIEPYWERGRECSDWNTLKMQSPTVRTQKTLLLLRGKFQLEHKQKEHSCLNLARINRRFPTRGQLSRILMRLFL
jgi:hypothetical protein